MNMPEQDRRGGEQEQKAVPAPPDRDALWAAAALQGELAALANLPSDENVNKDDSIFYASLVRIAAVVKGSGRTSIPPGEALAAVQDACSMYPWLEPKEIARQWRNAYNYADPRYRKD